MSRNIRILLGLALALLGALLVFHYLRPKPPAKVSRVEFQQLIDRGAIKNATISPTAYAGIYVVKGILKTGSGDRKFNVTTHLDEAHVKTLFGMKDVVIDISGRNSKAGWINLISTLLIAGVLIGLVTYQLNLGKSKRTHRIKERPEVRFEDVAGVEEAKAEVQEVVDFLKNPKKYKTVGGKLPKGILLVGPPGTGKTMLAKAIAGEANANFFSVHGSDFNEVYVGVGAKRVRELFRQAVKHQPSIIFIDEVDCLGKSRKHDTNGELQQTNNALLAAMDGFEGSEGVVVIAATNRPEDLDDALMRPGRFDRKVFVSHPDMKGRRAILTAHTRNRPIQNKEQVINVIAQTTPGMSGADLASVLNEAAILSAQRNLTEITMQEMEQSRDKVRFGQERRSMILQTKEREMVAYHEAGHAIINLECSLMPPLYKVSIVPRGQALGVTTLLPNEDQNLQTKDFLLQELLVLMGGRAAEKVFYGGTTNGANGDLQNAKQIARSMIHEWGMGERLYYEPQKSDAETEINRLLENADNQALNLVQSKKQQTEKLAKALLERETLTREEVIELLRA